MSLLTHQSFANDKTPYWLSNPVEYLRFAGTPPVDVSNNNGELFANGVSMSPATWFNYPANGVVLLDDDGDRLQIISNDLYFNSNLIALAGSISNVSDWYLYPALSNVGLNAGVGIDFDGRLLSRSGTDLFFGGVNLNSSTWASYPATGNVAVSNFSLIDVSGITASSNMKVDVASLLTTTANTISNRCKKFSVVADRIAEVDLETEINLTAQNGKRGLVNIVADRGGALGGKVSIVAEGANNAGFVYGGLVEITANSGGILPVGFTSAVKINGASVLSYAGASAPYGSLAGYNFVYGTAGVNIVAGSPPVLPNVVGSVYLNGIFGEGGTGGVRVDNGLAIDYICPISNPPDNPDMEIRGNDAGQKVKLMNIRSLEMEGDITGLGNMTMTGNIGGVSTINMVGTGGNISNVSTINGFPYNPVRNWANFPAIGSVDMSGNDINRVGTIRLGEPDPYTTDGVGFTRAEPFLGAGLYPAVGTITGLSGADGAFRTTSIIITEPSSYPLGLSNDLMMTSAWNYIDGVKRIGVVSDSFAKVLAYLDDIPKSHGDMSSSVSQGIVATSTPLVFTYTDFGTLVGITESAGKIYSTNGGSYLLTFCIQFARTGGGGGGSAEAEAWIRKNGTDVPNTNSRQIFQGGSAEAVMTIPINIEMSAGDYVEVVYCATNTNVVAQAFPARTTPWTAPAIPSIIVNIDQVG